MRRSVQFVRARRRTRRPTLHILLRLLIVAVAIGAGALGAIAWREHNAHNGIGPGRIVVSPHGRRRPGEPPCRRGRRPRVGCAQTGRAARHVEV